eukprot:TRINITY_DN84438_c0_g1_i1.p1 TRINITY_DN84438_c0_g1~~TRINITY_DN84438_c0_g1_i1.p1  ORF type:complete len:273 (+),score=30.66 TRINITY_DN84438_c0_g1_i1:111-929(+)
MPSVNRFSALTDTGAGTDDESCDGASSGEGKARDAASLPPFSCDVPTAADDASTAFTEAKLTSQASRKDSKLRFDYYAIVDFECTCDNRAARGSFKHEIIEFPVVFLNSHTLEVDFEFHRYVRPTEQPRLSQFCNRLTGIDQRTVDVADTLDTVLCEFHDFLLEHQFVCCRADRGPDNPLFVICTDGPSDLKSFLQPECKRKKVQLQSYWSRFIDVRRCFNASAAKPISGLVNILASLGLSFEGREHSGIDDARNIARIAGEMLRNGRRLGM